jgi:hypothetical protein
MLFMFFLVGTAMRLAPVVTTFEFPQLPWWQEVVEMKGIIEFFFWVSLILIFRSMKVEVDYVHRGIPSQLFLLRKLATQERVDEVLEKLAIAFYNASEEEAYVLARVRRKESGFSKLYLEVREWETREAKDNFWNAHAAARALNFEVRESFKDYLPEKLRAKPAAKSAEPTRKGMEK